MAKHAPNSKHYRKLADDAWSLIIRQVGHCEICGKQGTARKDGQMVKGLDAHHLVNRTNLRYRHDLSNGVCLCKGCHEYSRDYSPHYSLDSAAGFLEWLQTERPGQYQFFEEARHDKRQRDESYQAAYERLQAILDDESIRQASNKPADVG